MWGSYYTIPKAIFYLLKGEYSLGKGNSHAIKALGLWDLERKIVEYPKL